MDAYKRLVYSGCYCSGFLTNTTVFLYGCLMFTKLLSSVAKEDLKEGWDAVGERILPRPVGRSAGIKIESSSAALKLSKSKSKKVAKGASQGVAPHVLRDLFKKVTTGGSDASSGLMPSLIDPKQIYTFRLTNTGTASSSTGLWQGFFNIDPTTSSEWSSISALFAQYRIAGVKWTIVPMAQDITSGTAVSRPALMCSIDIGIINTSPANLASVADNPNARYISLLPGMPHESYQWSVAGLQNEFMWATVSSGPAPYAGSYGEVQFYGNSYGSNDNFSWMLEYEVQLRARS
jgi:hypothetical protein